MGTFASEHADESFVEEIEGFDIPIAVPIATQAPRREDFMPCSEAVKWIAKENRTVAKSGIRVLRDWAAAGRVSIWVGEGCLWAVNPDGEIDEREYSDKPVEVTHWRNLLCAHPAGWRDDDLRFYRGGGYCRDDLGLFQYFADFSGILLNIADLEIALATPNPNALRKKLLDKRDRASREEELRAFLLSQPDLLVATKTELHARIVKTYNTRFPQLMRRRLIKGLRDSPADVVAPESGEGMAGG